MNEAINVSKRAAGKAEELEGKLKKKLGKRTGDEQMEAEGRAMQHEGEELQEVAKAEERAKGEAEEATGAHLKRVGKTIDDPKLVAEGKALKDQGEARKKMNK